MPSRRPQSTATAGRADGDGDAAAFASHAARLLADDRCERVLVLDLRGLSSITDFFVIATGTSDRQMASTASDLVELAKTEGRSPYSPGWPELGDWIVCDYGQVIVHLFTDAMRQYYDLESLWADAPRLDWASLTTPGQFARIGAVPGT